LLIRNATKGTVLADRADAANTSWKRRRGLLGRPLLETGEGLWIVPCEAIHTIGMKFAIDVMYLSRQKTVLKLSRAVKPWRISACLRAHSVVELPPGTIESTSTTRGDQIEITG
jgi:uncharacterized membrane protein (UPF0127 family)